MNNLDRDFQAELTRKVREEVFASPELAEEYRRRHARDRWWKVLAGIVGIVMGPPMLAIAAAGLPLVIFAPAHVLLAKDYLPNESPVGHAETDLVLGAQSVMILALACLAFGFSLGSLFCFASDLPLAAYYPVADRELRRQPTSSWAFYLAYYLYALALLYGVLAWRDGLSCLQICSLGAIAVLQAWHLMSLGIFATRWIRTQPWIAWFGIFSGIAIGLGSFYAFMIMSSAPSERQHSVALGVFTLPTGWINGALYYGVLRGNLAGWLFLRPVAVTSAYAAWWLRRGYAIREFHASAQSGLTPIFEYGLPNRYRGDEVAAPQPLRRQAAAASLAPESEQAIEKRLLQHAALAPPVWSRRWFLERWIGSRLTDRERTLLEQFYGGPPRWTAAWLVFSTLSLVYTAVMIAVRQFEGPDQGPTPLVAFVLMTVAMCEFFVTSPQVRDVQMRTAPRLHPIFPVGLREMLAVLKWTFAYRAVLYLPLVGIAGVAENWRRTAIWLYAPVGILVGSIQLMIGLAISARMDFDTLNRYRFQWRRYVGIGWLSLAGILAFPLIMWIDPVASPVLAVLSLAFTWRACRDFDYLYLKTEYDFTAPQPMTPIHRNQTGVQGW